MRLCLGRDLVALMGLWVDDWESMSMGERGLCDMAGNMFATPSCVAVELLVILAIAFLRSLAVRLATKT